MKTQPDPDPKNHLGIEIRSASGREVPRLKIGSLAWRDAEDDPRWWVDKANRGERKEK